MVFEPKNGRSKYSLNVKLPIVEKNRISSAKYRLSKRSSKKLKETDEKLNKELIELAAETLITKKTVTEK